MHGADGAGGGAIKERRHRIVAGADYKWPRRCGWPVNAKLCCQWTGSADAKKTVGRGRKQESTESDDYPEATSEARSLPGHGLPEFHPLLTGNQSDSGDPTPPKSRSGQNLLFYPDCLYIAFIPWVHYERDDLQVIIHKW